MRKIWTALAVAVLMSGLASASDKTDVMATVHQFVDSFNKGDVKAAVAACTDQAAIIDEFPPYEWHGAGACSAWAKDYDADARKNGTSDGAVTVDNPRHIAITADRAYVVAPVSFTYKQKGKPMKETGSTWTLVLQKGEAGWRITAWAWAQH